MKTRLTIILFSLYLVSFGQEKGKLFQESNHWGGFGGVSFTINPSGNMAIAGEGAWIFKNYYIGGQGLSSNYGFHTSPENSNNYEIKRGMGGLLLGAFSNTNNPFALYTELRIGFGEITAQRAVSSNLFEFYETNATTYTPSVGVCYSPNRYIQIRAYGGYEYTSNFNMVGINNTDINGAIFGFGLYFGYL